MFNILVQGHHTITLWTYTHLETAMWSSPRPSLE